MLMGVKKHLYLIWLYFKLNLSAAMEYRISFFTQAIGMMLSNASFIFFWWIVYKQMDVIGGYTFRDVMILWSLASSTFGLSQVVFGNSRGLGNMIANGELDVYLLQPKNVFVNVLCSRSTFSAWGDLAYGFILFLGINGFDIFKLLLFTTFVIMGGLVVMSSLVFAESLTFFIGNSNLIARQVMEFLITFMIYPEGIYRKYVRWIIYTIIPAGFVVFIPSRIINVFSWKSLLLVLFVDIIYVFLAYTFFQKGLKRYESGNLMGTRI